MTRISMVVGNPSRMKIFEVVILVPNYLNIQNKERASAKCVLMKEGFLALNDISEIDSLRGRVACTALFPGVTISELPGSNPRRAPRPCRVTCSIYFRVWVFVAPLFSISTTHLLLDQGNIICDVVQRIFIYS